MKFEIREIEQGVLRDHGFLIRDNHRAPVSVHDFPGSWSWQAADLGLSQEDATTAKALIEKALSGKKVAKPPPVASQPPDYGLQRKRAYPTFGEQLDMIYHDLVDGTTKWRDTIGAIKARHPKVE